MKILWTLSPIATFHKHFCKINIPIHFMDTITNSNISQHFCKINIPDIRLNFLVHITFTILSQEITLSLSIMHYCKLLSSFQIVSSDHFLQREFSWVDFPLGIVFTISLCFWGVERNGNGDGCRKGSEGMGCDSVLTSSTPHWFQILQSVHYKMPHDPHT